MKNYVKKFFLIMTCLVLLITSFPFPSHAASNEEIIYNFLKNNMGLNTAAACGVLANIEKESNFRNDVIEYGYTWSSGGGYGICQWTNSPRTASSGRRTSLVNWCNDNGYDYTSLTGQLNYLKHELNTSYYYNLVTKRLLEQDNNADGAYWAAYYWCYYFEVPAGYNTGVSETRGNIAKNTYWPKYSGSTPPSPSYTIDTRYPTPFYAYNLANANTPAYSSVSGTCVGNIYADDQCTIQEVYTNGWCKLLCPWDGYSNGRTVYTETSVFLTGVPKQTTAYQKADTSLRAGGSAWGWVDPGDTIYTMGTASSGKYTQIIYPTSNGFLRCAWVQTADLGKPTVSRSTYVRGWLSDPNGNEKTTFYLGDAVRLTYEIYDKNTGDLYNSYANDTYSVTLTLYKPDGSVSYSNTVRTDDTSWIQHSLVGYDYGTCSWKVVVKWDDGSSDTTVSGKFTVGINSSSSTITASKSSMSLSLISKPSDTISYTVSGVWPDNSKIDFVYDKSIIKVEGSGNPFTVTALKAGTTDLKVVVYVSKDDVFTDSNTIRTLTTRVEVTDDRSYTLTYNANGGTGAPSSETGSATYYISTTRPTRVGYTLLGWSTSSSASSVSYYPSTPISRLTNRITISKNTTLYAVWTPATTAFSSSNTLSVTPSYGGQTVCYKFTPTSSGKYTIVGTVPGTNYKNKLILYSSSGTELASGMSSDSNTATAISYNFVSGNTYYFTTTRSGTTSNPTDTYTVTLYKDIIKAPYWGDVDSSNSVGYEDRDKLSKYLANLASLTNEEKCFADLNLNGEVDIADLSMLNNYILYNTTPNAETLAKYEVIPPTKTQYKVGESLNTSGLKIRISNKNNSSVKYEFSNNITVKGYNSSTPGKQTLTATYRGLSLTFDVTVVSDTFTLSYNANGGTGAPSNQTGAKSYTISSTVPVNLPKTFLGWSTSSSATSATYKPGDIINLTADTTLYAVWKSAPTLITGSATTATIGFANQECHYTFTPSTSGTYIFESTGSLDSKVYVYNKSGTQLGSNDDGGSGNNFKLEIEMTAGTSYTIGVRAYSGNTGSTTFTVTKKAMRGDLNGDGYVDAGDAVLISRYDAGLITLTTAQLTAGDLNNDGYVDAGDAVIISRYDAGLISNI